jgi:hypothetical protein
MEAYENVGAEPKAQHVSHQRPPLDKGLNRAHSQTVEVAGASYSVYVSHPKEVADLIASAARGLEIAPAPQEVPIPRRGLPYKLKQSNELVAWRKYL